MSLVGRCGELIFYATNPIGKRIRYTIDLWLIRFRY
jgi:hypothetical protein